MLSAEIYIPGFCRYAISLPQGKHHQRQRHHLPPGKHHQRQRHHLPPGKHHQRQRHHLPQANLVNDFIFDEIIIPHNIIQIKYFYPFYRKPAVNFAISSVRKRGKPVI
ncbi:MAG: hypothetical protein IJO74_00390 [Clostridia bacterium]|nr:hypothetical protein [Clostridia bacterium]